MGAVQTTQISSPIQLVLPPIFAINQVWEGNILQQLLLPGCKVEGHLSAFQEGRINGYLLTPDTSPDEPILVITNNAKPPEGFDKILSSRPRLFEDKNKKTIDISTCRWIRHPSLSMVPASPVDYQMEIDANFNSWEGVFKYQVENSDRGIPGLRPAQIGALHAIHAHWAVSDEAATIVLPTGTGKTETMLSVLVSARCPRILVVVPTDALRIQIYEKFLTLGILKVIGVIPGSARYPIVGMLKHQPKDCRMVDEFFTRCQVVVTTMSIAGRCGIGKEARLKLEADGQNIDHDSLSDTSQWQEEIQKRMASLCPFLFVDEAHHIAASTWSDFKANFISNRILQFTATPFRNDERPVGGKIIFNYPMRKAQEEGYFEPIRFLPVEEFDLSLADAAIARKAVEQLHLDWEHGHPHILMARVETVERAEEVFRHYEKYKDFNPVQIHTGMKVKARQEARQKILNGEARIVVCVDMLGEGFDLPALKIAAFHDVRKSLAVTLQLAGRFTRTKSNLGEPTFVANIADVNVQEKLSHLYAQDADWNALLRRSSEYAIQEQVDLYDYIEGFKHLPKELPLQNIRPPMNLVLYQTECLEWTPEKFDQGVQGPGSLEKLVYDINTERDTLIAVLARKVPLDWAVLEGIYNWQWELYVLYWDKSQSLLYIAGAHSGGLCKKLADAVGGFSFQAGLEFVDDLLRSRLSPGFRQVFLDQNICLSPDPAIDISEKKKRGESPRKWEIFDKKRGRNYEVTQGAKSLNIQVSTRVIHGLPVFRSFHGINRLTFHNVGLTEPYGGLVSYIMRAGSNVVEAISSAERTRSYEANMAGAGFENREKTNLGCSRSGKIWSQGNVNFERLSAWFQEIGTKVLNEKINLKDILACSLKPVEIHERPKVMPVAVEWPKEVLIEPEIATQFIFPAEQLFKVHLDPVNDLINGPASEYLRHVFQTKGIQLSPQIEISTRTDGKQWDLHDPGLGLVYSLFADEQASDVFDLVRPSAAEPLAQMEIRLKNASEDDLLLFEVLSDEKTVTLEQTFYGGLQFSQVDGPSILVRRGYSTYQLDEFFDQYPPIIRFADGSFLEGNTYTPLAVDLHPYPAQKIRAWQWVGTNIRSESQGPMKKADSIQYRVLQELKKQDYDLIYDDDGSGEAADVVAVHVDNLSKRIAVDFFHCKFSSEKTAGGRVKDLYEVCGQAQKCIHWMDHSTELFQHLLRREHRKKEHTSRIEKGDKTLLQKLSEMSKLRPVDIRVFIVQPGFAKNQASLEQLRLLSVTENYLMETYQVPFGVIASSFLAQIDHQFESDLINAALSESLWLALRKHGIQLSDHVRVSPAGGKSSWCVEDLETEQVILVEKTPDGLNLYTESEK